jgi:hypothetical protein
MKTLITHIAKAIKAGEPDSKVDAVIQDYIEDNGIPLAITSWKVQNYDLLRSWAYPPVEEYLDAIVKMADENLAAEGHAQYDEYINACLAVKKRFSKGAKNG